MNTATTNIVAINEVQAHTTTAKLEELARLSMLAKNCNIEVSIFLMGAQNEWLSFYCANENIDVLVNLEEPSVTHELNKLIVMLMSFIPAAAAAHEEKQAIALFNEQNQPFSTANSKLVLEEVNELFNDARNIKHSTIELNQTQTSEGMEAYPFQQLSITESISAFNYVQSSVNYGDYQPLNLWPSAIDREKSTGLNMVCKKLAEAELYISLLLAEKAA